MSVQTIELGEGRTEYVFPTDLAMVETVLDCIIDAVGAVEVFIEAEIFGIRLALEEAIVNAFKHGNKMDQQKAVRVQVQIAREACRFVIADEGVGYSPEHVPNPLADENLERPCGRGLFLMKSYMTEVVVHRPGNRVELKKIPSKKAS